MQDLARFFRSVLAAGPATEMAGLTPWLGWMSVSLLRLQHRINASAIALEAETLDGDRSETSLPGHPGWSYDWDDLEQFAELRGPGGERFCFARGQAPLSGWGLSQWMGSFDERALPEQRLTHWLPHRELIQRSMPILTTAPWELLEPADQRGTFALTPAFSDLASAIAAEDFEDPITRRTWRLALGDHPDREQPHRESLRDWLVNQLEQSGDFELLRSVRAVLPSSDLHRLAIEGIAGPPGSYAAVSIETLDSLRDDDAAKPLVWRYLQRLRPRSDHPYSAWCACRFLLERAFESARVLRIAHRFADIRRVRGFRGNPFDDRWAELLLEYDPHRALPRVAQALRSATPACWHGIAGLLAAIDQPWSRRTLEGALRQGQDPDLADPQGMDASRRRALAAALSLSADAYAQSVAAEFLPPPPTPDARPSFTYDEVTHEDLRSRVAAAAHAARDTGVRLRAHLPADLDLTQKPCP